MPMKLLCRIPGILILMLSVLLLFGCNTATRERNSFSDAVVVADRSDWSQGSCHDLEQRFNSSVRASGAGNALALPSAADPLLKVDRFLLSLASQVDRANPIENAQWVALAASLAIDVRDMENTNLDPPWPSQAMARLADCSRAIGTDPQVAQEVATASATESVHSNYSLVPKILGFYRLLRPIFSSRIHRLHEEERALFERPTEFARSLYYIPAESDAESDADFTKPDFEASVSLNPLRLPLLDEDEIADLFEHHAPALEIEQRRDNDRVGAIAWRDNTLAIDLDQPIAYTYASYTLFEGEYLLQLNYQFWFPERGPRAAIDLYSGFLDGLIWRVTLDRDGEVLLYDSIHSCGCYHKYFVVNDRLLEREPADSSEPAIVFEVPALSTARPKLLVSSNEHYIVGLEPYLYSSTNGETREFSLLDYGELSTLKHGERGSKSMFDARGIVIGSERLERFTLWPTGIPSVGAMRQRGNHAIGFVEEQHFDDATLLDYYFRRSRSEPRR